jgi:hypothetical protein
VIADSGCAVIMRHLVRFVGAKKSGGIHSLWRKSESRSPGDAMLDADLTRLRLVALFPPGAARVRLRTPKTCSGRVWRLRASSPVRKTQIYKIGNRHFATTGVRIFPAGIC